jgi:type I restriction enzyme S subunit
MDTKKLRQKILDLAIRGKLIPQDPNDEPASVLIEKIRVEKEQLIKEKKIKRDKNESYIYRSDKSYYEKFADGTTKCIDEEIPFGIPESWEWCRLGSIAKNVLYGVSKSAQTEGDYRLLRITDIQNNSVDWENVPFTTLPKEKVSEYLLEQHDILFARTGATVGKSYLVNEVNNNVIYASYLIRVRLFEMFNSQYIKFYFESGFYWGQVTDKSVGVGQPNVNGTSLKSLLIPIPPYEEQLLIGKQALELTDIIHNINNSQKDLSDYIQDTKSKILDLAIQGKLVPQNPSDEPASVLLERIKSEYPNSKKKVSKTSDNSHYPFDIPESWEWCSLDQISQHISAGGDKPVNYSVSKTSKYSIPIYSNGKDKDGLYGYTDNATINKPSITISARGTIGFSCIRFEPFCPIVRLISITPNILIIDIIYLHYTLMSLIPQGEGSSIPQLTIPNIKPKEIPIPPILEQKRIVKKIEDIFASLDEIVNSIIA